MSRCARRTVPGRGPDLRRRVDRRALARHRPRRGVRFRARLAPHARRGAPGPKPRRRPGGDAAPTYYACLLQQVGATADLHVRAEILGDTQSAVKNHLMPVWYGEPRQQLVALVSAVAPDAPPWVRAVEITRKVPRAMRVIPQADLACREVCPMYVESFRLPAAVGALFEYIDERWDGKGGLGAGGGEGGL